MFKDSALSVAASVVGDASCAGTPVKVVAPDVVVTVTSKWPGVVETTSTVAELDEVSVDCRVMVRRYLSPPKRRDDSDVHGDGLPTGEGVVWSRSAMKSAACAKILGSTSVQAEKSSLKCFCGDKLQWKPSGRRNVLLSHPNESGF